MKKITWILICFCFLLAGYDFFLIKYPLKKSLFYTNEERTEAYIYKKNKYSIVIAGSSLSGAFEYTEKPFTEAYFDLFLPFTGACTGIEIIKRSQKVPEILYVEINHIDRGIDSTLVNDMFGEPLHSLKHYMPFLLKENQLLPNMVDRIKPPKNNGPNELQPPAVLYNALLANEQKEWDKIDTSKINQNFAALEKTLAGFSKSGSKIIFFEVPMDSSLYHSKLLTYQRKSIEHIVSCSNYKFIKIDTSRAYKTGDGLHMLKNDAIAYVKYFKIQAGKL